MPNKIQVGQKVLLKNQIKMDRKGGTGFGPSTSHSLSNNILYSLTNKDGAQTKIEDNVFLLKPYFDSEETKDTCDECSLPVQTHDTE